MFLTNKNACTILITISPNSGDSCLQEVFILVFWIGGRSYMYMYGCTRRRWFLMRGGDTWSFDCNTTVYHG